MFIGNEVVEFFERCHVDGLRRRGIENATDPMLSGKCNRVIHRLNGNFELQHDAIHRFEHISGGIDIHRLDRVVGAFDYKNPILPAGLHKNRRHPAGYSLNLLYMGRINSLLAEVFDGGGAE